MKRVIANGRCISRHPAAITSGVETTKRNPQRAKTKARIAVDIPIRSPSPPR
jgi:hypothetical protein